MSATPATTTEQDPLETREGAEAFIQSHIWYCKTIIEKEGGMSPLAAILGRNSPDGRRLDHVGLTLIPALGDFGPRAKDAFSEFLREAVIRCDAVGIAFSSEAWMAYVDPFCAGGLPADRPDRIEILMVTFEHVAYAEPRMFHLRISRDAEGRPTLGEPEEQKPTRQEGRFFNFMRRSGSS